MSSEKNMTNEERANELVGEWREQRLGAYAFDGTLSLHESDQDALEKRIAKALAEAEERGRKRGIGEATEAAKRLILERFNGLYARGAVEEIAAHLRGLAHDGPWFADARKEGSHE